MIGISTLYCGVASPADALRYGAERARPVVVWNATQRCNLQCAHCYSGSTERPARDELTTDEGKALLADLAGFGVPVVLFSGGEPLLRDDVLELAAFAADQGMRTVLSTNGTLIDGRLARSIKAARVSYVGVSLDGLRETNDAFRGQAGAFDQALAGIRHCLAEGVKVGLRFTVNRRNVGDVADVFALARAEGIRRLCFYHLVPSGRARGLADDSLSHAETRALVDRIIDQADALHRAGFPADVLTVDNHADGPYLYLRMLREGRSDAANVLDRLRANGGNASGRRIGCVGWDGEVYADQFLRRQSFGNVRERPFSEIWQDRSLPLLSRLRSRKAHITGRCATCRFFDACNGNLRARTLAITGDLWASDPACHLTDDEIRSEPPRD